MKRFGTGVLAVAGVAASVYLAAGVVVAWSSKYLLSDPWWGRKSGVCL